MKIRAIVVDDEPLARRRLRDLLAAEAEVELVAECAGGEEAIGVILRERPDLVFLDVQMPRCDGFAVIEAVGPDRMPAVIFVTAYDHHALRAFDLHAHDYLLKPFDGERFRRALAGSLARLRRPNAEERLLALLDDLKAERSYLRRLAVHKERRTLFLRVDDVEWIAAEGNYARVHLERASHLVRETLTHLEERLDPARFARIHRSTIVNLDRIGELQPWSRGEYLVLLRDGTRLVTSRAYRGRVDALLAKGR